MNRRKMFGATLAAAAMAAAALTSAGSATAAPDGTTAITSGGMTMVNAAGRTVTLPADAAKSLSGLAGGAAGAGRSGFTGPAGKAGVATTKAEPIGTNTVIGPDGRYQESVPTSYPWGAIAHLETNQGGCTGFMLSRDVLVTAGHCVHHGGQWVTSYTVTPGRQGYPNAPFGQCSGGINDVWTTWNWINGYPSDHDYGLIKLNCDIGYSTGWFGWWYNTGENLNNQYFYVEGYPGDKSYGTMWWDGDSSYSYTANKLWYWIDTAGGQSGSPVYHNGSVTPGLCGGWCVTAIHTNGVAGSNPTNSGTRLRPDVMSFINYWINQP